MKKSIKILAIFVILVIIVVIIVTLAKKNDKIVICIDAGHGGSDAGATSEGRYEKNDTLKVAKLVKQYLENKNIEVVMTRDSDETTTLQERCKIANKKRADLFVSIHRNSAEFGNGIEIWTSSNKKQKDIQLATSILDEILKTEIQSNRGIKYGTIKGENTNYYVLNNTKMPSCLIELGFITNDKDNNLLDNNIESYAQAIADGIIEEIKKE